MYDYPIYRKREPVSHNSGCLGTLIVLILFWGTVIHFGCNTLKKDTKNVTIAQSRNPQVVANDCAVFYPCITQKQDTNISSYDSSFLISCPDNENYYDNNDTLRVHDTLYQKVVTNNKVFKTDTVKVKLPVTVITKIILDSAAQKVLQAKLDAMTENRDNLQTTCTSQQTKITSLTKWQGIYWLIIALLIVTSYLLGKGKLASGIASLKKLF